MCCMSFRGRPTALLDAPAAKVLPQRSRTRTRTTTRTTRTKKPRPKKLIPRLSKIWRLLFLQYRPGADIPAPFLSAESLHQPVQRSCGFAPGKDRPGKCCIIDSQVLLEDALEHGAQVGRRLEIAVLKEIAFLDPRPVGDHTPALQRAAGQDHDRAGAVVGALAAIDARGAAELGGERDHRLAPGVAHLAPDRRNRVVERR